MQLITAELFDDLLNKAGSSPRKRTNVNFHDDLSDVVQKILIGTKMGTYFRPHRHAVNYEFALVLKGSFSLLLFDDAGVVTDRQIISAGSDAIGFQIQPNQWHTLVTLEDDSVFFEVKQGSYDPQVAAEFALWSPEEGAPEVAAFVGNLCMAAIGQRVECE